MIIIGICGQSGSGKSLVCEHYKKLGIPLVDADKIAREIVEKGSPCLESLTSYFGIQILKEDGSLDRKKLAELAFKNKENTEALNRITHGFILGDAEKKFEKYRKSGEKTVIFDAPVLFESGADRLCDITVAVIAPRKDQIKRIVLRDGIDEKSAVTRIRRQISKKTLREKCDFVIYNSGNLEELYEKSDRILENIRERIMNTGKEDTNGKRFH